MVGMHKDIKDYTIFISIAAFNETYIKNTLDEALKNADYPNRLHFGIWEHSTTGEFTDTSSYFNIKHSKLSYNTVLGVSFARLGAFLFYDQEDFILQIDAHMLFKEHWDTILIERFLQIAAYTKSDKNIISTSLHWWQPQSDGSIYRSWTGDNVITVLNYDAKPLILEVDPITIEQHLLDKEYTEYLEYCKMNSGQYKALHSNGVNQWVRQFNTAEEAIEWLSIGYNDAGNAPKHQGTNAEGVEADFIEHYNISAHFIFTIGTFIQDILPDPFLTFIGEEQTTGLRAWTRGYRIFSIRDTLLWHLDKNGIKNENDRWFVPGDLEYRTHFYHREALSQARTKQLLTGQLLGYWGAPDKEALKNYETIDNIDFNKFYNGVHDYYWKKN